MLVGFIEITECLKIVLPELFLRWKFARRHKIGNLMRQNYRNWNLYTDGNYVRQWVTNPHRSIIEDFVPYVEYVM